MSFLLGWGAIVYSLMPLIYLDLLTPIPLYGLYAVLSAASLFGLWNFFGTFKESVKTWLMEANERRWMTAALVFAGWIALASALMPPTQSDGLRYHLTAPALYLRHGGFEVLPHLSFSNFPFFMEYLYLVPLSLGVISGPKLIHAAAFFITLSLVSRLGRRLGGPNAGWMAALLVAATPFVPIFAGWSFIEFGLAAYTLAALVGCIALRDRLRESKDGGVWRETVLLGVFCGFLLGCKYTALATLGFLWWAVVWPTGKDGAGWLRRVTIASGAMTLAVAIASPWFIKNALLFGNPVQPFGSSLFPTPGWSEFNAAFFSYHAGMKGDLIAVKQAPLWRQAVDFITLPFRMTVFSGVRAPEDFGQLPTGILWLSGVILLMFQRRLPRPSALCGWMGAFLFFFWAYTYRDIRFLLPCFVSLAPVLGRVISDWVAGTRDFRWIVFAAVLHNLLLTFGLTLIPGTYMPWWVISGRVTQEEYLTEISDETRHQNQAFKYLDQNTTPETKVLLHGVQEPFYCHNEYVWSDWFNTDVLIMWSWQAKSVDDLAQRLRDEGIEYVVYNYGNIRQYYNFYQLFRLPQDRGLPLIKELTSKETARVYYPYDYQYWMQRFAGKVAAAEAASPNVAILDQLLNGGVLQEVFRYDEKPSDPTEGIAVLRVRPAGLNEPAGPGDGGE
ncbi:MAG: hypothetical protein GC154_17435 [bacterium]|nr:hypothetical protein [bacterium]